MAKKKVLSFIHTVFFLGVVFVILYIIMINRAGTENVSSFDDTRVELWNDGWDINYDGNVVEDISLPMDVPVKRGNTVMLRKTLPDKIKEYNCIMLEGRRQDIAVSVGGIQRALHSNKENRRWGKTSPSGVVLVPLYNTDSRTDVTIHITSDSVFSGQIGDIYIGNEKSLIIMMLKKSLFSIFCTLIVFIIGVICFVCYITYASYFDITKSFHYLSGYAILSAVWSYSQLSIGQMFGNNLTTLETIGYVCYMLLPVPLILFVNGVTENRYKKPIIIYATISGANFVIETLLLIVFRVGFFDMRYVTWLLLFVCVLGMITISIFEIKRKFSTMSKLLFLSSLCLLIGIIGELALYSVKTLYSGFGIFIGMTLIFLAIEFTYITVCVGYEQQKRKDAESANRAKSLFLATMSHEIKTPINAVIGMNEMIMRDTKEDAIREYSANIRNAGEHLVALVNDILDFSKIESGKMDIVCVEYSVKTLLQDLIIMTETRIKGKKLKLVLDIDENIPTTLYGDHIRIKQVAMNLLTNATKYTPEGEITFTVKNLSTDNKKARIFFGVKDTGTGIKAEDIDKMMGSFVRIDQVKNSSIEGTGLGLAICSQLLELMGSKLEAESIYGEGSDFHFTIQQKVIDEKPMGSLSVKHNNDKAKKITFEAPNVRVLAVDDTKINNMVLKGLLKPTKMQVDVCDSGAACLDLCRQNQYDIVFMDHMMPEMDGIETFKRLRADSESKSSNANVFVLTANTVAGSSEFYKECGFDYYFKKPIDVTELNEVLQRFLP